VFFMVWVWEWVAISFIQLRATAPPIAAKATDHRRRFLAKQFNVWPDQRRFLWPVHINKYDQA
jgi:hypothetical protein